MLGARIQSYAGQLGHHGHASARRSWVARSEVSCRAAAAGSRSAQPSPESQSVDRRQVLSALIATGALLLPTRTSVAEETEAAALDISPVTAPDLDAEAVAQVPLAAQEGEPAAPPDSSALSQQPAAEVASAPQPSTSGSDSALSPATPTLVFMDLTINGDPAGRITIQLFADVPGGAARFSELAAGRQGVDYRLSKFNGVLPTYIRNDGLSRLSYSASEVSPIAFGDSLDALEAELEGQARRHDQPGLVSLIVKEREARPVKERLVARDGKLITVLEQAGEAPNGTQFTITTAASPELDATNLIIGQVVGGQELLKRIAALPVNKPRNDNPYFQAGKAMGDKRAVTAERAFYRPFQKVVVASSGVLS